MYTKPIIYKAYSIVVAIFSFLLLLGSVISLFSVPSDVFNGLSSVQGVGADGVEAIKAVFIGIKIAFLIVVIVSVFFTYMDVSSIYTFAQMIEHEQSKTKAPFIKQPFTMSSKAYRRFGTIVFTVYAIISFIAIIALVISYSISQSAFLAVPVIPVAINLLTLFLYYITYYCRYKTFSDLLDVVSSEEPSVITLDNLKENKSGVLRGYCIFLFAVTMLLIAATVVGIIVIAGPVISAVGFGLFWVVAALIVIPSVLAILSLCVIGCYFDNLAKMLEHYQIKYNLL